MTAKSIEPLIVERTLEAPVELVWRCLTNKDDVHRWFFELNEFKPEVGFKFDFAVEHEGMKFCHLCRVTEVIPKKKLAFTWRYDGHEGDSLVTLELLAEGAKTKLKLTHVGLETFPKTPQFGRKNFESGWNFITTALKKYVESDTLDRDIVVWRVLDAPRELVWEAMTNPKHVVNWWGPRGFTTNIEKMDFRVGGEWKHVMHGPDGREYPNLSVFTEIVRPERIVMEHGGGEKGKRQVNFVQTMMFEEVAKDKTRVIIRLVFPTKDARDFVVREHKAIEGGKQTLERFAEYVRTL